MCGPMKWSGGEHILDEMKRARLWRGQSCISVVRKDTFPIEAFCKSVCTYQKRLF